MTKQLLIIFFVGLTMMGYSQGKNEKLNAIGISIPIIYNKSEGTYYSTGNRKEPTGEAVSFGININYSKKLFKNIFGIVGIGYFKQSFKIIRPFYFNGDSITNLLYSTKKYSYSNIQWFGGLGYKYSINKALQIKGMITYNLFTSFQQYYQPTALTSSAHKPSQTEKKYFQMGNNICFSGGFEKRVARNIYLGIDAVIPFFSNWKNDETFIKYPYSDDSQQIARNRFSIGTSISCYYHF